ncbi:MAG: tyrosine-type recombinase/integrase [Terracidiphilus sp.]
MRVQRHTSGSVRYDKRRKTWNYLWYDGPTRRSKRIGTKQEFPTKAAAWKEVESLEILAKPPDGDKGDTVRSVVARYEAERMPSRQSTVRVYRSFLNNHVLPKWADTRIQDVQPRPVELWLRELPLSPKSKTHVRSLMHGLVEFAMWSGMLDISRNPVSLVRNIGATRKVRKARSLTAEQFHALLRELQEPFGTMALLSVCLGLRFSEALALRWSDVDWLDSRLSIRRGIVNQIVGDVKTQGSAKTFNLASELLERLKSWKQSSQFSGAEDWIFASPFKLGRLPYSYTGTRQELERASKAAGIGHISSHAFRHTYRSWLDAVKTPIAVQQKMMRHTDIRTTMNIYGDVVTDEMSTAGLRVAELAFQINGAQAERESS